MLSRAPSPQLKYASGAGQHPMTEYSAVGRGPQSGKPGNSGWIPLSLAGKAGKKWNFIPLAPGLFCGICAYSLYPLLDGQYVLAGLVFLFFLLTWLAPRTTLFSSVALALLAGTLLLNGALDKSPPTEIKTTIISKASVTGSQRMGTHYHLVVSSWRPGRNREDFQVDLGVYRRAVVGRAAMVEMHKGYFGIAWHGDISPQ
jgi:hypothetical protein